MKRYMIEKLGSCLLILICLFSACGCNKSDSANSPQQSFNERMHRQAYLGTTKSTLYLNGYDRGPSVNGKGTFNIDKISGDESTLVLMLELPGQEGFSFAIPGKQNAASWSFSAEVGSLSIKENGEVKASITAGQKQISWDGRLFDDKLMLDVKIKYLSAEGDISKESILDTHFELQRSGSQQGGAGQQGCTIVWESRPVFNLYAGGVDLIYVPVCQ